MDRELMETVWRPARRLRVVRAGGRAAARGQSFGYPRAWVMPRCAAAICLLVAAFAAPAHAQGPPLVPGVTYERTVEFTPHGAVVLHVLTAPRPGDQNGLYQLAPVLAKGTVLGARERVTQIEKDVSSQATVAGINGDFFSTADAQPAGVFIQYR